MSSGHGGARQGSGRKRKALAEKVLYAGNGHHRITKLEHMDFSQEIGGVDGLKLNDKKSLGGACIDAKPLDPSQHTNIAGSDMPQVSEYLRKMTKNTNENLAPDVYAKTWQWLKERKCENFVKRELIEQYALYIARDRKSVV